MRTLCWPVSGDSEEGQQGTDALLRILQELISNPPLFKLCRGHTLCFLLSLNSLTRYRIAIHGNEHCNEYNVNCSKVKAIPFINTLLQVKVLKLLLKFTSYFYFVAVQHRLSTHKYTQKGTHNKCLKYAD